jgi:hypothetical protein
MYYTFLRAANNWKDFANNPKIVQETGLTLAEARERCKEYNENLSEDEKDKGIKLEFESE